MSLTQNKRYATLLQGAARRRDALLRGLFGESRTFLAMFHDVCAQDSPPADEYACTAAAFTAWLDGMLSDGWTFLSVDALLSKPFFAHRRRCCALTFDDGFASLATVAQPILAARNVPYTVYIATDYPGKAGYLTEEALKALASDPRCTVGSHSVSHPLFRFLDRERAVWELTESKRRLERLLGKPIVHFAFPYGSVYAVSRRDRALAKACGYHSAALTDQHALLCPSPFKLPRMNMPAYLPRG